MSQIGAPRRVGKKTVLSAPHEFELDIGSTAWFDKPFATLVNRFNQFRDSGFESHIHVVDSTSLQKPLPISQEVSQSSEVAIFVMENNLKSTFDLANILISELIPGVEAVQSSLMSDDETDERWINLLIIVKAEPATILAADDRLLDAWIDSISRDKNDLVKFDYKFSK